LSLKQDIEMVKEELNSEEKFFEKAVITEKFVKKYKKAMIGSVVAVVAFVGISVTMQISKQNTLDGANKTLIELEADVSNEATLSRLKSLSPVLYEVWSYSQAIANKDVAALEKLKKSNTALLGDLATYELVSNSQDLASLNSYALNQNAIYKDLARVQVAILLMNNSKIDEAHEKLSQIGVESPLSKIANALMHYGVK